MMYAYDELYLNDAMRNLGEAFDYSATVLKIPMDDFLDMFIISGIAEQFASGVPKFVSGLSGTELVWEVFAFKYRICYINKLFLRRFVQGGV